MDSRKVYKFVAIHLKLTHILLLSSTLFKIAAADPEDYWTGGATEDLCGRTRNGCHCKDQWGWSGKLYSGCQRPDNDPMGSWCIIDQNCQFDREDQVYMVRDIFGNHTGDYWQYCNGYYCPLGSGVEQKEECFSTVAGCKCKQDWSYIGGDGGMYNGYRGCANPDNDETGDWCVVDPDTCINTPPGNTESLFPKQTDEMWDHCQCKSKGVITGAKISLPSAKSSSLDLKIATEEEQPSMVVNLPQSRSGCNVATIPSCFGGS